MSEKSESRAGAVALVVFTILALAVGNVALLAYIVERMTGVVSHGLPMDTLRTLGTRVPELLGAMAGAHLVALIIAALAVRSRRSARPAVTVTESPTVDLTAPALRVLALLQSEGRLIDFLEEDIDAYNDGQVGAAVRSIHAGCRKALHDRMKIERVYGAEDGSTIAVEAGFDPAAVRLTGNVHGQPPFRGTLQHGGWRAVDVHLPEPSTGTDHNVLAPAEVEIP